jgi:hypothetical protein
MRSIKLLVVTLLIAFAGSAYAQSDDIRAVERWRVTFDFTERGSYSSDNARWTVDVVASGMAVLTRRPNDNNSFIGTPTINVHYRFSGVIGLRDGTCITEVEIDSQASPTVLANSARLDLYADGFQLNLGNPSLTVDRRTTNRCPDEEIIDGVSGKSWGHSVLHRFAYPASGTTLSGSYRSEEQVDPEQPTIEEATRVQGDLQVRIVPDSVEELKLEIDESEAYKTWRPRANKDGSAGAPLNIEAKIVTTSGQAPSVEARRWNWKLVETSREPGIAMNFPADANDTRPDLELEADPGDPVTLGAEAQTLERNVTGGVSDGVRIAPRDWGGWANLEVTVTLEDGRTLEGKAKVAGTTGLRLPKRAEDSHIADAWKEGAGVRAADDADDESDPPGDGTNGDGLSLYQEYRGFYEDGQHVGGNPERKDLFVRAFEAAASGLALFKRLTRLVVHPRLTAAELPLSRVINANRREGAGSTDQHGLLVTMGDARAQEAGTTRILGQAVGGPGNPKKISQIRLMSDWALLSLPERNQVVAHELLHAVNVWHHGPERDEIVAWVVDRDGEVAERNTRGESKIRVFTEPNNEVTANYLALLTQPQAQANVRLWLGVEGAQHSGYEGCVMRYTTAHAYVGNPDVTRRYRATELPSAGICLSSQGTGVNGVRTPQSRYGDAGMGRGNCKGQILVSDAVEAPAR